MLNLRDKKVTICFDLGGVLVQIRHAWDAAMMSVGLPCPESLRRPLGEFSGLSKYQEGTLSEQEYLSGLSNFLGVAPSVALDVHRAILDKDYEGAESLIRALHRRGKFTCCFSNTNALHWSVLTNGALHPAVAALDARFASHEIALAKPELAAFRKVSELLPSHEEVVFFDDTLENVTAANNFGWIGFHIDPQKDPVVQMRDTLIEMGVLPED